MDSNKLIKLILTLAAIVVVVGSFARILQRNNMSLTDYENLMIQEGKIDPSASTVQADENTQVSSEASSETNSQDTVAVDEKDNSENSPDKAFEADADSQASADPFNSALVGATLNATVDPELRITLCEGFYSEPLSENLIRYITGISYPANTEVISTDGLRYLHIMHYDFNGNTTEGELICNQAISNDLLEIFSELYLNEYQLESVRLIDEYNGDDVASMEANNTSCFNYRVVEGSTNLSKHAYGLAIDINPLYNPYVTYNNDGTVNISPENGTSYADRSSQFSYKIDTNDLCYSLFTRHGFIWGGNWNSCKDYQHFQKNLP